MHFKVIAIFKVEFGQAEEELRRCSRSMEFLREQPGFLSYEAVESGEDEVAVIQGWRTREQFHQAMALAQERPELIQEDYAALARDFHAGELAFSSHGAGL